jgi:hypothetical protein
MDPIHHVLESIGIDAAFQCDFGVRQRAASFPVHAFPVPRFRIQDIDGERGDSDFV